MKHKFFGSSTIILMVITLLLVAVSPVAAFPAETVRVWVSYHNGKAGEVLKTLNENKANVIYDFPDLGAFVVELPSPALSGITKNPFVIDIEEDAERYPMEAMSSQVNAEALNTIDPNGQIVPYGIDMVQARDVWDANRDGTVDAGAPTGSTRTLCIIDTGYYQDHEDLPNAVGGYSQVDDNWARDGFGHGSHVGGTIAAENNTLGVVGVTPGTVNLYIVKFFNDAGEATFASDLVDALSRCRNAGANVVSMSLGGSRSVRSEKTAFQNAYDAGVLSIAAAGNDGTSAYSYPASYPSVVSVAAIDSNKQVADFSQYNDQVELAAPGVGVLSTLPYVDLNTITINNTTFSGGYIENAARGTVSGALVNGGLCGSTGSWAGKVVLCQRGTYDFYTKVMNVQNSGGVAAVLYNNVSGGFLGTLGDGNSSAIPAISLSLEDGQTLVNSYLGSIATVTSQVTKPASGYEAWDGTSMATPHVSAVAALVWSANPAWTNVQIREALTATAEDLGAAGRDAYYGYGLVQAKSALDYLTGGTQPNTPPSIAISSPANNSSFPQGTAINFIATANDAEDGDLTSSIVWTLNGTVLFTGGSFTKSDLAVGTHTVIATVTDNGGLQASASVTFSVIEPVTNQLVVTVTTDKPSYVNSQKVTITTTVKDQNGVAVPSAAVSVVVTGANGSSSTLKATTNTSGIATVSYRISTRKTGIGIYTITSTASKAGYLNGSGTATFIVN